MTDKRDLSDIEKWVGGKTDLSGGDFTEAVLNGKDLTSGLFANSDFTNADLSESCLEGCDFTGARFNNADLSGCNIADAVFTDADLTGVDLRDALIERAIFNNCKGIIDAGMDPRGYRFVGVKQDNSSWRVKAGCRWYSITQALDHWREADNDDALARVQDIIDRANPSPI